MIPGRRWRRPEGTPPPRPCRGRGPDRTGQQVAPRVVSAAPTPSGARVARGGTGRPGRRLTGRRAGPPYRPETLSAARSRPQTPSGAFVRPTRSRAGPDLRHTGAREHSSAAGCRRQPGTAPRASAQDPAPRHGAQGIRTGPAPHHEPIRMTRRPDPDPTPDHEPTRRTRHRTQRRRARPGAAPRADATPAMEDDGEVRAPAPAGRPPWRTRAAPVPPPFLSRSQVPAPAGGSRYPPPRPRPDTRSGPSPGARACTSGKGPWRVPAPLLAASRSVAVPPPARVTAPVGPPVGPGGPVPSRGVRWRSSCRPRGSGGL